MKIQVRKNRTTLIAFIIVGTLHILVGWIFWNSDLAAQIKDTVLKGMTVKPSTPPPPPPPPPPKIELMAPPKVDVKFEVKDPVANANKVPDFDLGWDLDMNVGNDAIGLAMGTGLNTEELNVGVDLVANSITNVLGMEDFGLKPGQAKSRTRVIGKGRRMSGVIPATLLATDKDSKSETNGKWDFLWRVESSPMEAVQKYFLEETNLRLNEKTKVVDLSSDASFTKLLKQTSEQGYTFDEDFTNLVNKILGKDVPVELKGNNLEPELVAIDRLRALMTYIHNDDNSLRMNTWDLLNLILRDYHEKKYAIKNGSVEQADSLLKQIEKSQRQQVRAWRVTSIKNLSSFLRVKKGQKLSPSDLQLIYGYFKKAEILLNPVVLAQPYYGIKLSDQDNINVLVNYISNGGVFYLTDPTTYKDNITRNRGFVRDLISKIEGEVKLDAATTKVFNKLSAEDRDIPGYQLFKPSQNFMHPRMPVEFEIPTMEKVKLEVFNRLGQSVRTLANQSMRSNAYTYARHNGLMWMADDDEGLDLESGIYFVQMTAGLFRNTKMRVIPSLRRVKEEKHPVFSSYYNLGAIPTALQDPAVMRNYDEDGVHAYEYRHKGRMAIFYSEGYGELHGFGHSQSSTNKEQAAFWARNSSRWMANFFAYILGQDGGVTQWPG